MKKRVYLIMMCVMVFATVGLSVGRCLAAMPLEPDSLQYTLTKSTWATLSISSSGTATCTGYIRANSSDSTIDITLKLMKKNGNTWKPQKSWSAYNVQGTAELNKTCSVSSGTYKVIVSGAVKCSTGAKESISTSSGTKTYS